MILKVSRNASILTSDHRHLKPGMTVEPGMLTPSQVAEHLKSGYLVKVRDSRFRGAPGDLDQVPGVEVPRPLPLVKPGEGREEEIVEVRDPGSLLSRARAEEKGGAEVKKAHAFAEEEAEAAVAFPTFAFDPAILQDKSLEQLNTMILERIGDEGFEPFDTVEEARAFLSQDYEE